MQPLRLSGEWINFQEAIAWVRTRDAEFSISMRRETMSGLSLYTAEFFLATAPSLLTLPETEERLLNALRHGDLQASGRAGTMRTATGEVTAMLPIQWTDLALTEDGQGFPIARSLTAVEFWHNLLLQTSGLLKLFPPVVRPSQVFLLEDRGTGDDFSNLENQPRKSTAAARTQCERWLVGLMSASPHARPAPKTEYRSQAIEMFAVSSRSFDVAWSNAVSATLSNWSKAGAPKRSSGDA